MRLDEFLLARIAEDEADADQRHRMGCDHLDGVVALDRYDQDCDCGVPTRVLAECAAKRAIVGEHPVNPDSRDGDGYPEVCGTCNTDDDPLSGAAWPCPTLRNLAAVYADHPDYRPEWSVTGS